MSASVDCKERTCLACKAKPCNEGKPFNPKEHLFSP